MAAAQKRLSLLLGSCCTKGDFGPSCITVLKSCSFHRGPSLPQTWGGPRIPAQRLQQALCSFCPLGLVLSLQPKL